MANVEEALERLNSDFNKAWEYRNTNFDSNNKEICDFVYPNAKRFITGNDKHDRTAMKKVLFNNGKKSLEILASGMLSGTCSPSRVWFDLGVDKNNVAEDQNFKTALQALKDAVVSELSKSNFYRVMHQIFKQEGAFGTACALIDNFDEEDKDAPALDLILVPFGQYALRADYKNRVDGIYRKLSMNTSDIIRKFGEDGYNKQGLPQKIKDAIKEKKSDMFTVFHVLEKTPLEQMVEGEQILKKNYSSYYFLEGEKETFLDISGFDSMPAITPRWDVLGDDVYGESPASLSIGDMREAQKVRLLMLEGTERSINPPILLPTTMKDQSNRLVPRGVLYYEPDVVNESASVQGVNALNVRVDYTGVTAQFQDAINRIESAFYKDIFLMLDGFDQRQMTATEVAERKNEKMLMLGSVLERQTDEALRPAIQAIIDRILTNPNLATRYPDIVEAFKENSDSEYQIQFVSILAQAQKASGSANLERGTQFLLGIANANQDVSLSLNLEALIRHYIEMNSLPPDIVKTDEEVQQIKQQMAQQQQAQQQAELASKQAQALQQGSQGAGNLIDSASAINALGANPNI
jgi:hypothetical protein